MHEQEVSNRRQLKLQKDLNWQKKINPGVTWIGNRTSFLCQCWLVSQVTFLQQFVQATFKSPKLSELLALFRNPKIISRIPQISELHSTSFSNIYLNPKNFLPPLEKNLVDLPPPVQERSLTPFPQRLFGEVRTSCHRLGQSSAASHNRSDHFHKQGRMGLLDSSQSRTSTAHLGLAGALISLGAGIAEEISKTFLSTWSAFLDG